MTISISLPFTLTLTREEMNWFAVQEMEKEIPHWAITYTEDGCESYAASNEEVTIMKEQGMSVPASRRFKVHTVKYTGLHTLHINEV